MDVVRYMIQWGFFILIFCCGVLGLELAEGLKISTTEYFGLQNIGFVFIMMAFFFAVVLYPIVWLPLSIVIRKLIQKLWGRILIYVLLGAIGGRMVFQVLYEQRFVTEYQLNMSSAYLIFAAIGLIYALTDYGLEQFSARIKGMQTAK
ncbi:MAG: hypothetical protein ACE3L7_25180 [Candidatus Pristimantibacillus sp.]